MTKPTKEAPDYGKDIAELPGILEILERVKSQINSEDGAGYSEEDAGLLAGIVSMKGVIDQCITDYRSKFRESCNQLTIDLFGFEVFDDMDVYGLSEAPWMGMTPQEFIEKNFEEDYENLKAEEDYRKTLANCESNEGGSAK